MENTKYITNYKTSKAQEDCNYWEQLYKERQKEYYQAQEAYATYADDEKSTSNFTTGYAKRKSNY